MNCRRDNSTASFVVTGLKGFIGNRFQEIAADSYSIVPLALSESPVPQNSDEPSREEERAEKVLFHLAGPTGQPREAGEDEALRQSIVALAGRVAEELSRRKYSRLVFLSSGALEADDGSRLRRGGYARGKAEAEQVLTRAARQCGIPIAILRPTRVVGPEDRRRSLLPLMRWIARRRFVPFARDSWANFVYVDDVAAALLRAGSGKLPGGVYAVNEPILWPRFLEMIAASLSVSLRSLGVSASLLRAAARALAASKASQLELVAGRLGELAGAAPIRCEPLFGAWPDFPEVGLRRGLPVLAGWYRSRGLL
jgi:nucleoside-diphosphate-sugar epimerase